MSAVFRQVPNSLEIECTLCNTRLTSVKNITVHEEGSRHQLLVQTSQWNKSEKAEEVKRPDTIENNIKGLLSKTPEIASNEIAWEYRRAIGPIVGQRIHQELKRMVQAGLITRTEKENRTVYRLTQTPVPKPKMYVAKPRLVIKDDVATNDVAQLARSLLSSDPLQPEDFVRTWNSNSRAMVERILQMPVSKFSHVLDFTAKFKIFTDACCTLLPVTLIDFMRYYTNIYGTRRSTLIPFELASIVLDRNFKQRLASHAAIVSLFETTVVELLAEYNFSISIGAEKISMSVCFAVDVSRKTQDGDVVFSCKNCEKTDSVFSVIADHVASCVKTE